VIILIFSASQEPTELWLYAERYLLIGTRSYSPLAKINEMDAKWQPDSETPSFEVPCFWIEVSQHDKFIYNPHPLNLDLTKFYSPTPDRFLLPVHPATIPLLPLLVQDRIKELSPGPRLNASPTSSTRTLYIHGVSGSDTCPQHFLKLHFPGQISRFIRSLTRDDVIRQIWISGLIQKARLPHLPDLGGGYALPHENSSIGFLYRPIRTENGLDNPFFILPGYALYGLDKNSPSDPPLLAQLPYYFRESPLDFIVTRIIVPTVNLWVRTVSTLGIIPELHGQNLLFCFNRIGSVSSVSFRDSDLFIIDALIRRYLGVNRDQLPIKTLNENSKLTSDQALSLCYDAFLVNHFLVRVAAFAENWFDIPVSILRDATILAFRATGGDALLSQNRIYYFDDRFKGEDFVLVEKQSFGLWR
jgi:hypothetical protein